MKLLKNYFKPAVVGSLKAQYDIDYVEQAQAMSDHDLLLCRNVGKMFIARLREITPDPDGPKNYHPLPLPLHIGVIIQAYEALPDQKSVRDDQQVRIPVVQSGRPLVLVFQKEYRHYWQWQLVGVETVN